MPENTLSAVSEAWRQEADAVEADFRLTRDRQIVAIHDDSTLRLAGVDLRVAESTLSELRELDFGGWKADRFRGERIATLGQMLATMPAALPAALPAVSQADKRFYVEIKCGAEIAEPLADVVRESGVAEERIVLICFSAEVLVAVRRALPRSPTHLVVEFLRDPHSGLWFPDADALLDEAAEAELTGLDLMAARVDRCLPTGRDGPDWMCAFGRSMPSTKRGGSSN